MDIQAELARLRQKVDAIHGKHELTPRAREVARTPIEDLVSGEIVETARGRHFETERLFARSQRHGSYEISDIDDWPEDLLEALSGGEIGKVRPESIAFLDTETTGLAGGSGTCAFLIGVGRLAPDGFRVRQFFMRDFDEEASALEALKSHLSEFEVMVTYNGRSYDQPLLETRYTLTRSRHPFGELPHLDLLYGARRLFKLRLEDCRLVSLENSILGFDRGPDIPGELIPYTYFEFLRNGQAHRLVPVLQHNAFDIASLACLTGIIPQTFRDPAGARPRHGTDLLGPARWLSGSGRLEEALTLLRRAIDIGLPDGPLFRALYEAALMEKKLGRLDAAVGSLTELSLSRNPYRGRAFEELAKHYEHRERNFRMALECVRAARTEADSDNLVRRQERLEGKCKQQTALTLQVR